MLSDGFARGIEGDGGWSHYLPFANRISDVFG